MNKLITCTPRSLPDHKWLAAAAIAVEENPANHAPIERLLSVRPHLEPTKADIALLRTKYWGGAGVRLSVEFLDSPSAALRSRILAHLNMWNRSANVSFVETGYGGEVRIARAPGNGHWSYIGTDIRLIDASEPTMNLDSFSEGTPDSEFPRVVCHEAGHTLGFIHEHMRRALVVKIDPKKAISYYGATQGWSEEEVRAQVLTPIEESSLRGSVPDPDSIMCYQIPGEITYDGVPILGGLDLDDQDYALASKLYPQRGTAGAAVPPLKVRRSGNNGVVIFLGDSEPSYVAAVVNAMRAP